MKRYIDQGWEQRRRGRRWLTTRRGTHLRSIIGIVLGETGAIGARGGCYRGGGDTCAAWLSSFVAPPPRRGGEKKFFLKDALPRNGFGSLQAHRIVF